MAHDSVIIEQSIRAHTEQSNKIFLLKENDEKQFKFKNALLCATTCQYNVISFRVRWLCGYRSDFPTQRRSSD